MNLVDYRSAVDQELYEYRRARSATLQPNVMSEGHKKRAAAAAMVGMCAFKVGLSAFGPPFAELSCAMCTCRIHNILFGAHPHASHSWNEPDTER